MFDDYANFAIGVVATPPSPAASGTTLVLSSGHGARFPSVVNGFDAVVWPGVTTVPLSTNAEIVRVTGRTSDTLTITRAQESSSARTIVAGDYVMLHISKKMVADIIANFANYQALNSNLTAFAAKTAPVGAVVGTTDAQPLSAKTLSGIFPGSPTFSGKPTFTAVQPTIVTDVDGATVTFDMNAGTYHKVTLGGNRTLAVSNVGTPQAFQVILLQDGTGSRTVTWWAGIKWVSATIPPLTTTPNRYDIFSFLYDGVNFYGSIVGLNFG